MWRAVYSLLVTLLLPAAWLRLLRRARSEPAYAQHIGERFGRYSIETASPLIWVHAVSVGETRAAAPLITALIERYPAHRILLSHMTATGRETGVALFGERVSRCYLPYDAPFAVRRFLEHFRPSFGLVMETEVWPNLIAECRARNLPLWLINARLSEKSARRYARVRWLTESALNGLAGICAQTVADAERFRALGATRVEVCGNVKFDVTPPAAMLEWGRVLRSSFGPRPVLLAASTREGEEELLLATLRNVAIAHLLTVIVPRHPQRFDQVATLIEKAGFSMQRRSANQPANQSIEPSTEILLGDSMGEMFAWYAACDVAFIGGSLLPLGGQNLIEACAVGAPVLIGPHTFNFAEAATAAVACGAAQRVADAAALARAATQLLSDAAASAAMSRAGRQFAATHRGAVERIITAIK